MFRSQISWDNFVDSTDTHPHAVPWYFQRCIRHYSQGPLNIVEHLRTRPAYPASLCLKLITMKSHSPQSSTLSEGICKRPARAVARDIPDATSTLIIMRYRNCVLQQPMWFDFETGQQKMIFGEISLEHLIELNNYVAMWTYDDVLPLNQWRNNQNTIYIFRRLWNRRDDIAAA